MSSNRNETRIGGFAEEFELGGERKLYLVLETVCWDGELDFNCRGTGLVFRWQVLVREHSSRIGITDYGLSIHTDGHFKFSIDHHTMTVQAADFKQF